MERGEKAACSVSAQVVALRPTSVIDKLPTSDLKLDGLLPGRTCAFMC